MFQLGGGEGILIRSIGIRGRPINGGQEGDQLCGILADSLLGLHGSPCLVGLVRSTRERGRRKSVEVMNEREKKTKKKKTTKNTYEDMKDTHNLTSLRLSSSIYRA